MATRPEDPREPKKSRTNRWQTKLVQPTVHAPGDFKSLATPVHRGSTVLFDRQADVIDDWRQTEHGYSYGLYGTPTVLELGARIAEMEGAFHTFIVPGGQAAIALTYLTFCRSGSHALVPISGYGPNREMGEGLLKGLGIEVEAYDPLVGSGVAALIRPNTALIWTESPGSVTMEVQDVPAIVAAAHARGVPVALDNTYAAGVLFDAFAHGIDVSIQALTKYVGGHSDLLLGSMSVNCKETYESAGAVYKQLGMAVSPDDCSLALRGLQTLGVRLAHLESATLEIAHWLQHQPPVESVFHPALPSCPGHVHWQRDFTGSSGVFSILFAPQIACAQVAAFVDALELFRIGFSWGGVTSLVLAYPTLDRAGKDYGGRLVRLNIGLEETADLIADLDRAIRVMQEES
ncbi:cystathionine beta-lyase [Variovorax sp. J22G21]|uniref:cystathionine beta-lyase n=1 Tax=Variovorax fucosicus TaxID=3053517 RepID=UPI002576F0CA|nr:MULTISPECIES: cystathionine beta-lyase [unclassified Variovorax]MDM0041759.1 cystathionine beta-lyase [Variovorax sp. J22R193]MDM0059598.1 cystathionine beta-lyase [Variovorax sp. J22G21]